MIPASELKSELRERKLSSLTLEWGRGATYANGQPTLYGHGTYPRSSVLAGQHKRVFLDSFDSPEEAIEYLTAAGVKYDNLLGNHGSTYEDVESKVAHLPDTPDF